MQLNNIISGIIEPFGDPKEFFWCVELAKEEGITTINLIFLCNNISILTIELKIIPYYEIVLEMIIHVSNNMKIEKFTDILSKTQYRNWEIEIDSKGIHIYIRRDIERALKYILMILEKSCSKSNIIYTCSIGDG